MHDYLDNYGDDIPEPVGEVSIARWLWLAVCWDGLLPVCVLAIPQLTRKFGAGPHEAEMVAMLTPICAFFLRLGVGFYKLGQSHCGPTMRFFQGIVFFVAAFLLVLIDTMMILAMEMNNGRLWQSPGDVIVMSVLLGLYFAAMLFAFFPGRTPVTSHSESTDNDSHEAQWS